MMKKLSQIFFLFLILLISCESESPTISETGYGKLVVTSNVTQGEIFVGGEFSGLYTPDTLELLAVKHKIKVRKERYFSEEREISIPKNELITENFVLEKNEIVKNVIVEYFADETNSVPEGLNDLLGKNGQSIFIYYPFNLDEENSFSYTDEQHQLDRENYYVFIDLPIISIDGIIEEEFDLTYNVRLDTETKLEIVLQDTLTQGGMIVINAFVDVFELDGLNFDSLILRIALIENDILINAGETQKIFSSVFRSFAPDHEGLSLKGISKTGRARFVAEIFLHPRWKKENLRIIGFVQNDVTKEVCQVVQKSKISVQN